MRIKALGFLVVAAAMTFGCTQDASRQAIVEKVGQPTDVKFFGDQVLYMGDYEGYRYVHVRDMFDTYKNYGECTYRIPQSQWPMTHPMPLTEDPAYWQQVTWMNGDAPPGVSQNIFMNLTPTFPLGAPPASQPTQPAK